jgi:hypothetical protein
MSADKRKRWNRAMTFLREVNSWSYFRTGTMHINRKLSPTARYCIEHGLATLRREPRGGNTARTVFDTGLVERKGAR